MPGKARKDNVKQNFWNFSESVGKLMYAYFYGLGKKLLLKLPYHESVLGRP
jgi:hypothetical protein